MYAVSKRAIKLNSLKADFHCDIISREIKYGPFSIVVFREKLKKVDFFRRKLSKTNQIA